MPADDPRRLRRILLYALIGSILFGAVLGLVIILRNEWSWFEVRVILTAVTIAVASVCGMACDLSRSSRRANVIPHVGLGLTFLAAFVVLGGVWLGIESAVYWKTTACVAVFAVAAVHVCLLSMARLAPRFAWVHFLACQVAFGLAGVIAIMIVFEIDSHLTFRLVGALAIFDAALTLIVPVLHRISRMEAPGEHLVSPLGEQNLRAIDEELSRLRLRIRRLETLRAEIVGEGAPRA